MPRVEAIFVVRLTRRGFGGKITFDPLFLECSGVFVIWRVSIGLAPEHRCVRQQPRRSPGIHGRIFCTLKGITVVMSTGRDLAGAGR